MIVRIDDIDRAIIGLLQENGRISSAEIARHLANVSSRMVRYRIERLIDKGVIQVSAIVEPRTVGWDVRADVWIEVSPGRLMEVANRMTKFDQVSYVACSTGDRDISIQVCVRNNDELYHFVTEVVGNVPGVTRTRIMHVPLVLKDVYQWPIPQSD